MARRCKNYIGGQWVASQSDETRQVVNPATAELLAEVPMSTDQEVCAAIAAANQAFEEWRGTPPVDRARHLFRLRDKLEEEFEEFACLVTAEHGKTIDESRGEIRRAIEMVEVAAGMPSLMQGYNSEDVARGIDAYAVVEPLGVFDCLAPFNFPAMVPFWFIPFAVATGNTYIVKPSPIVPLSMAKASGSSFGIASISTLIPRFSLMLLTASSMTVMVGNASISILTSPNLSISSLSYWLIMSPPLDRSKGTSSESLLSPMRKPPK